MKYPSIFRIRQTHLRGHLRRTCLLLLLPTAALCVQAAEWSVTPPASLEQNDDYLIVTYGAAAAKEMNLSPVEPVTLPDGLTRIKLWYAEPVGETDITFIIRDASGEMHNVPVTHDTGIQPWAVGWDGSMRSNWAMWTALESINLKMPTPEEIDTRMTVEDAAITKALLWPKPWTLAAIRLSKGKIEWGSSGADRKAVNAETGKIIITDIIFETQNSFEADSYGQIVELLRWTRNEPMVLFLDDLVLPEGRSAYKGPINYVIKIRKGYQGPLIWERAGEGVLNRADPVALKEQAIELPELPRGNYFIQTDARDPGGALLETRMYQWFVAEGFEKDFDMLTENLRVETGQEHHVFKPDTTEAVLTIKHKDPTGVDLYEVEINDFMGNNILLKDIRAADLAPLSVPVNPGWDYFMTVKAVEDTKPRKVKEVALLHFGVANEPDPEGGSIPMPDLEELLKGTNQPHVEYWTREQAQQRYPFYSNIDMEDMKRWADHVKTYGWNILAIRTIWTDLEMLPGVTRFKQIDELMDHARENGQQVMLGCSIWGNRGEAVWTDWMPTRDQYGNYVERSWPASPYNKDSKEGKTQFWVNLTNHYKNDPSMVGYHTLGASISARVTPEEIRTDYSEEAQEVFSDWLKSKGRVDHPLARLLILPMMRASSMAPDLSTEWLDTTEFFAYTNKAAVEDYLHAIRSVDTERPVIIDRKPFPWAVEALVPMLAEDGNAALKNEGSPRFGDVILRTMSMQAGVPYLGELHRHIPSSESLADVIYLWESLWADYALWIQRWRYHQYADQWATRKDPLRRDVPEVLEFMKKSQPHWDELMSEPYDVPEVLVFGSRATENMGAQRRGFFDDFSGNTTFSALFRQHQVPVFAATEYTDWVDLNRFKVVFVDGYIQTQEAMDRLVEFAENGGKLVVVGDAGKYTARNSAQRDYIWDMVGDMPNVRRIDEAKTLDVNDIPAWTAPEAFDSEEIDNILEWAGVERPAEIACEAHPGFEVSTRRSPDGKHVYVAAMRNWYGWYRDRIEKKDVLRELFGMAKGTLTVNGLPDGQWKVRKFHRDEKDLGVMEATGGSVQFDTDEAEGAEVQLYELTLVEPGRGGSN